MAPTFAQLSHEQTPFTKPLRLVVAGEFSAGKSSLINRLVGQEVLPVGAIPVTDKPTELVVGQQVSVVFIDENGRVLETADSMTGSHPAQAVRAIVRVPEPLLGEVIIIDTPGINTAVGGDEQTLWLEVSGCDAVLWVFRASQAGKKSEKEFLSKLAARDIPVYGVINKTDLIEEQAREQVRASLQEGLGEYLSRLHVASATADSTKSLRKRVLEPVLEQSQTLRNGSELRRWRKVVAREVTRLNSGIEALTELNHRDRPSADFDINAEIRKWQVGVKKVLQWCMSMAETQESRGYKKATLRAEDIDFMRHRAETVLEVLAMQCLDAALHDARRLQGDAVYLGQAQCRSAAKDVLVQAEVTAHAKVSSIIHTALFSPGIVEAFRSRNNGGLAARFDFIEKRCQEVLESVGQQSFSRLLEQVDNARERVKRSLALEKLKKEFTQRFAESLRV